MLQIHIQFCIVFETYVFVNAETKCENVSE